MARSASQFVMIFGISAWRILDFLLFLYILVLGLVLDSTFRTQEPCRRSAARRQESRDIGTANGETTVSADRKRVNEKPISFWTPDGL